MIASWIAGTARAIAFAFALMTVVAPAHAQQPSAASIALAKEIIVAKGATSMYDPVIPNLIERTKGVLMQTNPMLGRDLNEVSAKLRAELAPRSAELVEDAAKLYAARFTEQELKTVLAFYKSPLGKKVITEEPAILNQSMSNVDTWIGKFANEVMSKFRAEMKKKGHDL
jgi:uncharacterized protein